jgi:hypothetical protein
MSLLEGGKNIEVMCDVSEHMHTHVCEREGKSENLYLTLTANNITFIFR